MLAVLVWLTFGAPFGRSDQKIVLVAGGQEAAVDIPATQAKLYEPFGVDFDPVGSLLIIEMSQGHRLLQIDATGTLSHMAGLQYHQGKEGNSAKKSAVRSGETPTSVSGFDELRSFAFNGPHNLAVRSAEEIYIADTWSGHIFQVDAKKFSLQKLSAWQVDAAQARSRGPYCVSLHPTQPILYVADLQRIHAIDLQSRHAHVVAGNGQKGKPQDGELAIEQPLVDPRAVAADRHGNVYILERNGNALRVVKSDGRIETVVNHAGKKGSSGDGGLAVDALLNGPKHLCVDANECVIIADAENHLIRCYDPKTKKIERVAGTGKSGSQGLDGSPLECSLNRPHGVTIHPKTGELYITDSYNHRILRIVNAE
jgi:DNA-binding beta-propeller fold protein YncE